jgi:hypothetical protein
MAGCLRDPGCCLGGNAQSTNFCIASSWRQASAEAALSKAVDEHKKALDAMRAASKKEVEAVTAAVTKEKAEVRIHQSDCSTC